MSDLVSILIPAYNADRWIAPSIASARDQTWPKKEIIIIDDGSTDKTLTLARRFENNFTKIVSQPNQGASSARNHALKLAQGDYIQWLDADDFLAPNKVEVQLSSGHLEARVLHSSAWGCFYYRPHKARFISNSLCENLDPIEWIIRKMEDNAWMAIENWLVSRELTEAAGPWNSAISMDDDGEYFSRVIMAAERIEYAPAAKTYVRRANLGSLSKTFSSRSKLESQFTSLTLQIDRLLARNDGVRARSACITLLQRWLIYFYPEQPDLVQQAQALAQKLGGELSTPEIRWKYKFLKDLFGWTAAKRVQTCLPRYRTWLALNWDRLMGRLGV